MKLLPSLSILSTVLAATATASELEISPRTLQRDPNPTEFCFMSVNVECKLTGTNKDCTSINPQPYGACGPRYMTMSYTFCNLGDSNIMPLRTNPSGEAGTVAMYRQEKPRPKLLLGLLPPGSCRTAEVTEEINTCKKRIVADLKFEGW